jgi:hypothetical protein
MARIISSGNTLFSPENYEKKKRERKRKLILWSSVLFVLLIILVVASRVERFKISAIEVLGARVITEEEITRSVRETLSGHYLWLVPRGNLALYPRPAVRNHLMKEFPRLSSVSTTLTGTALNVLVTERDPFALYCPDSNAPCFFLDENGFIFDEAPSFSGVVYFIYTKAVPIENPKGQELLPPDQFVKLARFIEDLPKLDLEPVTLVIKEEDLEVAMRNGLTLIWKADADVSVLYSNLEAFLTHEEIKSDPAFLEKVKLLDLRTENKVFYRFK